MSKILQSKYVYICLYLFVVRKRKDFIDDWLTAFAPFIIYDLALFNSFDYSILICISHFPTVRINATKNYQLL